METCAVPRQAGTGPARFAGMDFETALRRHADRVTRLCLVNTGNREDAKDCFQNVFLKLYLSQKEFSSEEHLKAWLIRVAVNECRSFHRTLWKRRVDLGYEEDEKTSPRQVPDSEEQIIYREECGRLLEALRSLPEKYREVLYLYYYESFSIGEISEILNLRVNTAKSRLLRGRKKLAERMGEK